MTETAGPPAAAPGRGRKTGRTERRGLTVERVHTTAGVHPYDEVTWQRRDVVMTNWRDGTVNFEQRGVEFPDFWSINATNVFDNRVRTFAAVPEIGRLVMSRLQFNF